MEGATLVHPLEGPLCLFPDHIDVADCLEQVLLLGRILYVGVDEQRVCFRVDVLHSDLETVEAPRLWHLHLRVNPDQIRGQALCDELPLNLDCLFDDGLDDLRLELVPEEGVEVTGKVCVQSLIP